MSHCGESLQVSLVMHGEYGMSETRELVSQQGQPLFERNSRDTFYMTSVLFLSHLCLKLLRLVSKQVGKFMQ